MSQDPSLPCGCTNAMIDAHMGGDWIECETCEGSGKQAASDCCSAEYAAPGYPDNDICSACGEHSQPDDCEDCKGKGGKSKDEIKAEAKEVAAEAAHEAWKESRYDS